MNLSENFLPHRPFQVSRWMSVPPWVQMIFLHGLVYPISLWYLEAQLELGQSFYCLAMLTYPRLRYFRPEIRPYDQGLLTIISEGGTLAGGGGGVG